MTEDAIRVLHVEDDPGDARLLRLLLGEAADTRFAWSHVVRLEDAIARLAAEPFDVVLLDLSLPDSHGLATFTRVHSEAPDVPVVVLTGHDDARVAVQAVHEGAQDFLVKGQAGGNLLARCVRYAIERHRMQQALRGQSLVDDLTGLYNRRGFVTLAEQQIKLAVRSRRQLLLVFADVDGLKQINDRFGHQAGDRAIRKAAELLRETFRTSDIVARLGGDEFTVLAIDVRDDGAELLARLGARLAQHDATRTHPWPLGLSVGVARFDPAVPLALDELMARADAVLYAEKKRKKSGGKAAANGGSGTESS